jgi:hypothetical protein
MGSSRKVDGEARIYLWLFVYLHEMKQWKLLKWKKAEGG